MAPAPTQAAPATVVASPKRGGQLVVAEIQDPTSLDPAVFTGRPGARAAQMVFDPLLDLDVNGKYVPALATSWELSSDARSVVLKLRSGVKFHDGTAFDAAAVKSHFDRHMNPDTKSLRTGELAEIAAVTAVDPMTIKIDLKAPNPTFLSLLIDWNAFIESPTAVQRYGADFGRNPVGTGPFKFSEYVKDSHLVLNRNPEYWDTGKPYLESLKVRFIPSPPTRLVEVQSGGAHIALEPPLQDMPALLNSTNPIVSRQPYGRMTFWFWNKNSPYGSSKEFRQALNWAADREGIKKAVWFDTGVVRFAPFHLGTPFDDPEYKPFTRNLDKARELVAAAQRNGVPSPPRFTLYVGPDGSYGLTAQVLQANLAEIGVTMDIQNVSDAAYQDITNRGDFNLAIYRGGVSWRNEPAPTLRRYFHSKSTYSDYVVKDPEVDKLVEAGEAEPSVEKRKAIYRQLADKLNDDALYSFSYNEEVFIVLTPNVQGWVHRPDTKSHFQDVWLA
jgi:peptide/nickel transport system substrate-binding protein